MNKQECAKVLAKIQLGDNRQVDALTLDEWFDTIGHLEFADAIEAVTMHRQESTDWLMPAHVIKNVRRVREKHEIDVVAAQARGLIGAWSRGDRLPRDVMERLTAARLEARRDQWGNAIAG